jgi:hypothetical protein
MSPNRFFSPAALALGSAFLLACTDQPGVMDPSRIEPTPSGAPAFNLAAQSTADTRVSVSMTFTESVAPAIKSGDCPVSPEGFCGRGEVIPFGQAIEMIDFGAACGGACDFRTINLPQGSIFIEETFSNFACPGSCHPNPAEPVSGTLTDVIVGGTDLFQGSTGTLAGSVNAAGGESQVQLSGTITLAS